VVTNLGYICLSEGVQLRLAIKGKYTFILFLFQIFIYNPFVMRHFTGTCSPVEMLKGYVVRECLGILESVFFQHMVWYGLTSGTILMQRRQKNWLKDRPLILQS